MRKIECDVAIIGAGLAGLATAYHLSKFSDLRIHLLDCAEDYASQASGKNAGMLRQAQEQALLLPLVQETLRALKNSPDDFVRPNCFRSTGSLLLGSFDKIEWLSRNLSEGGGYSEIFPRGGYPKELHPQIKDWLELADYEALLWTPEDGVVDVRALAENFFHAARTRAVEWHPGWKVQRAERSAGAWEIHGGEIKLRAPAIVNAAGAWAGTLAASSGIESIEIQPFRRHLFFASEKSGAAGACPIIWNIEQEFYFRGGPEGWILSPGDEDPHPPGEPTEDPAALGLLTRKISAYFPPLSDLRVDRAWACLRTRAKDRPYLIEEDPANPGWFWVAGLGGYGVSVSWAVGKRAAEEIAKSIKRVTPFPNHCNSCPG